MHELHTDASLSVLTAIDKKDRKFSIERDLDNSWHNWHHWTAFFPGTGGIRFNNVIKMLAIR